jgi:hypothetical protein
MPAASYHALLVVEEVVGVVVLVEVVDVVVETLLKCCRFFKSFSPP